MLTKLALPQQFSFQEDGDDRPAKMPAEVRLKSEAVQELSKLKPYRGLFQVAFEWSIVFTLILAQKFLLPIWTYPITLLLIATRQHALGILLHDAVHFLLLKNRRWNDLLADWLVAFPLLISTYGYRREHFAHHKWTGSQQDPDWVRTQVPHYTQTKSSTQLFKKIALYLAGVFSIRDTIEALYTYKLSVDLSKAANISRLAFVAVVLGIFYHFNLWWDYLFYWFFPMFFGLFGLLYFRLKAEHEGIPATKYLNTRTVIPSRLEKILISPNNVNYHLEHHLYPNVPFYRLPSLHSKLRELDVFNKNAQITQGYFSGFVRELSSVTASNSESSTGLQKSE
ncbi:fatty acid desaturase family protein [bacterium]|nr:fatty acid desaturase family protein [bacterium]